MRYFCAIKLRKIISLWYFDVQMKFFVGHKQWQKNNIWGSKLKYFYLIANCKKLKKNMKKTLLIALLFLGNLFIVSGQHKIKKISKFFNNMNTVFNDEPFSHDTLYSILHYNAQQQLISYQGFIQNGVPLCVDTVFNQYSYQNSRVNKFISIKKKKKYTYRDTTYQEKSKTDKVYYCDEQFISIDTLTKHYDYMDDKLVKEVEIYGNSHPTTYLYEYDKNVLRKKKEVRYGGFTYVTIYDSLGRDIGSYRNLPDDVIEYTKYYNDERGLLTREEHTKWEILYYYNNNKQLIKKVSKDLPTMIRSEEDKRRADSIATYYNENGTIKQIEEFKLPKWQDKKEYQYNEFGKIDKIITKDINDEVYAVFAYKYNKYQEVVEYIEIIGNNINNHIRYVYEYWE